MAESPADMMSRVQMMSLGEDLGTWDLSPNDRAALCYALDRQRQLADCLSLVVRELESERHTLFDSCTNAAGEFDADEAGEDARAEVELWDGLIQRAKGLIGAEVPHA